MKTVFSLLHFSILFENPDFHLPRNIFPENIYFRVAGGGFYYVYVCITALIMVFLMARQVSLLIVCGLEHAVAIRLVRR